MEQMPHTARRGGKLRQGMRGVAACIDRIERVFHSLRVIAEISFADADAEKLLRLLVPAPSAVKATATKNEKDEDPSTPT